MTTSAVEETTFSPSTQASKKIKFGPANDFQRELKRRVDRYFELSQLSRSGGWPMARKSLLIMTWLGVSYVALVFGNIPLWQSILVALCLALAASAVGFNIQHDGGHRAYSRNPKINKLMAMTIDLVGGSSYFWDRKHNQLHHTYANITGHDDDIELGFLGRLSPHQRRLWFHRFQHIYLWALYGFLTIKWEIVDDFKMYIAGHINGHPVGRPKGLEAIVFFGGKVFFFSLALLIPMLLHTWWIVLLFYVGVTFVMGVVLSVVFQLAHCVEDAAFPLPDEATNRIENNWYVHQIETTADFARGNRFLTWFLGGLNYQVEHHLFPNICHLHYPAISAIVEGVCADYGVSYKGQHSFFGSIRSHYRWLRQMGLPARSTGMGVHA